MVVSGVDAPVVGRLVSMKGLAVLETVFASEDVPPADWFDSWYDLMLHRSAPTKVTGGHTADFPAQLRELDLGVTQVAVFRTPAYTVRRTPALVRRSDPEC
jgi:hypothetical protein